MARNTVFVGHTQPSPEDDAGANPFAMDVGPFNKYSKLACDDSSPDHCAYSKGGISFNLNPYPGQKLFNIYDGPSHQTYNAFLDINIAKMTCAPSSDRVTPAACRRLWLSKRPLPKTLLGLQNLGLESLNAESCPVRSTFKRNSDLPS